MTTGKLAKNQSEDSKIPSQNGSISGGSKLRKLREHRKLLQFDLDFDGIITQANYSKIERGLSAPSKEKLEAILDALDASFNDRQDVLKAFGYQPPYPLPEPQETEAMRLRCQPILDELPVPAYLVDIITRLVTWNILFEQLARGRAALEPLLGQPLFRAQFASRLRLRQFMNGVDEVLREDVYATYERLALHSQEKWHQDFIEELCEEPTFQHYWNEVVALGPREPPPVSFADRILHPIRFHMSDGSGSVLNFYSNPELLQNDSRFQLIYLIPSDPLTMRQLERWRER